MVNKEYADAYTEILEILTYIDVDDYRKIPNDMIKFFIANANKKYNFVYDPTKTLEENKVSERAKKIIAVLFCDYWATDSQKEKIKEYDKKYFQRIEKEKKEKYNPDEIFGNTEKEEERMMGQIKERMQLLEYEEPKWYKRIFSKIFSFKKK